MILLLLTLGGSARRNVSPEFKLGGGDGDGGDDDDADDDADDVCCFVVCCLLVLFFFDYPKQMVSNPLENK